MTTDPFTEAARAEAEDYARTPRMNVGTVRDRITEAHQAGTEWARDHLAAHEPDGGHGPRTTAAIREWTGAWPAAQEPTDAEVEAARLALHQALAPDWMGIANVLGADQREYDALLDELARAALSAARTARRDEEKRDD